jgi:predicted 2-oxoglutarate/Fe(II)-dependent dioxygenase YbiX
MIDIRDYIVVAKDVLPLDTCDAVLREYANTNEWVDTVTRGGLIKTIRSAMTILMSTDSTIAVNTEVRKDLDKQVYQAASFAMAKYNSRFSNVSIEEDSGYELLRYETGQFYTEHTDAFKYRPRAVSCSFSLNEDYEGGEFAFFNNQFRIKIPKGSALMFPSNFMYPHQILPVTKGTRYSIVTWFA